jgi:glycosyltransferase involved in cell wall biosynthesis
MPPVELTILMPCLNESLTLPACIGKAKASLERLGIEGEVLIADNGSTDGSQEIARKLGARVVPVQEKGYGAALRGGIEAAAGKFIIMGDADDSYDFSAIDDFVHKLREGWDLVMGCRLPSGGGTIMPGAMPWKHRWLGNPVLTFLGRLFFKCPAHDFHCGLRGFTKEAYERINLRTTGMEFASEMVIKATQRGLKITEVPITLHKDGRDRPPHLRSWRDGWRHLRFMLLFSPRWLFMWPGALVFLLGFVSFLVLGLGPLPIGPVTLDTNTMLVAGMATVLGFQMLFFGVFAKLYGVSRGFLPENPALTTAYKYFNLERGILAGLVFVLVGIGFLVAGLLRWKEAGFGPMEYPGTLRQVISAVTFLTIGVQVVFGSFFLGFLGLKHD